MNKNGFVEIILLAAIALYSLGFGIANNIVQKHAKEFQQVKAETHEANS